MTCSALLMGRGLARTQGLSSDPSAMAESCRRSTPTSRRLRGWPSPAIKSLTALEAGWPGRPRACDTSAWGSAWFVTARL